MGMCDRCKCELKVRINPGHWTTQICRCGCLIKYWDITSESNRALVHSLLTVAYMKTTFVPSDAHKRMVKVDELQDEQVEKAGRIYGRK